MTSLSINFVYQLFLVALLVSLFAVAPSMAAMTLSGVKYMADVAPGTTVTFPMTLSTAASDAAGDYEVTVLGFGNAVDGGYAGIDPEKDIGAYTARPFITLDKSTVHIVPGGKEVVTATIKVPESGNGGRYALINIHPKTTGSGTMSFTVAMNVPVMITLKGSQLTETGVIDSISVSDPVSGKSVDATTVFSNTGNHHYYNIKNEIVVTDILGKEVTRAETSPLNTAIVPGGKVNFIQPINASMSPGVYTVASRVFDGKGTILATNNSSFTITESHAAPTPTSSVMQSPGVMRPSGTAGIPGANPASSPLSVTTIVLALSAAGFLIMMNRKF